MIKRVISIALALMLVVACFAGITVSADEVTDVEFNAFVSYGGDLSEEGDWGQCAWNGVDENGATNTTATLKVGETVTVSMAFESATVNTWCVMPCLVSDINSEITAMDVTVTCKINGEDVEITVPDDAATWWVEGTGDYDTCIRLYGGYNEWGTQYIAEPTAMTSIEYTITLNSVSTGSDGDSADAELPSEFSAFVSYGGDLSEEGDWGQCAWNGVDENGVTNTTATLKVGETVTVSMTFENPTLNTWCVMPCLVSDGNAAVGDMDVTVTCKINGEDVEITVPEDAATWWVEGTGDYDTCIRLYGGYNEWGTQYIAEPTAMTSIEYTITLNSVSGASADGDTDGDADDTTAAEFDPDGTYNAYLQVQTPNWTYRDAWYDANGIGSDYWGQWIYGNETDLTYGVVTDAVIAGNGTYTVSVTDFGTIFSDDFATAGQDYFNILAISTDIPVGADVEITDVKLIIDGATKHTYASAYINEESEDYIQILIQNIWNEDVKEISYYAAPTTSLEMQFTISGFNYDAETADDSADDVQQTEAPAATDAPGNDDNGDDNGSSNGWIIAVVVIVVVAVVVVIVVKKKKAN